MNTIETKPLCAFLSDIGRHVSHGERKNTIDIGGRRSKV